MTQHSISRPGLESLSRRQAEFLTLRQEGKTNKEIAALVDCSPNVVKKTLTVAYRKLGLKGGLAQGRNQQMTELKKPEAAAALLDAATDPFHSIAEAIKASGLPQGTGEAVLRRLRTRFKPVERAMHDLKTGEIVRMLNDRIHLALTYMDEKVIAEASFRDLSLGTSALIEKRNLLRGEPTQILSDHERKRMHELLPLMIVEAQRRGITLEGSYTAVPAPAGPSEC